MNVNPYRPPTAYLRRCVWVSLRKRAYWVLVLAALGALTALLVGWPWWAVLLLSLLGGGGYAAWVTADSWQRHSRDVVAGGVSQAEWAEDSSY